MTYTLAPIKPPNDKNPKNTLLRTDNLAFIVKEIANEKSKTIPIKGLININKIEAVTKMINLDLILINAKIIKLMQAKVMESLPIADVQILRVGKKITNSEKNFKGDLIFFVNVLIFDAKAREPIFPKKENTNVTE